MRKRPKSLPIPQEKRPRAETPPGDEKRPRAIEPGVMSQTPLWSLSIIDLDGPFAWSRFDGAGIVELLQRLRSYESMTWGEIEGAESHFVERDQCCKEARDRLVELRQDDVDTLFSFRISGRKRVWGIRDGRVLRLLWWDPEHRVSPSRKKHT